MTELPTLEGSGWGQAIAINNAGLIVGHALSLVYGYFRPVIWENGQVIDLGTFVRDNSGDGVCIDVNEAGDVVGYTSRDFFSNQAFIYRNGEKTPLPEKPYWTKCDYFFNCGVVQCTEGTNNCSCPPDGGTLEG